MSSLKSAVSLLQKMMLWILFLQQITYNAASPQPQKFTDFDTPAFVSHKEMLNSFNAVPSSLKMKITEKDLNESVAFASGSVSHMKRLETNLAWSNIHIQKGSPSHGQLIESAPEPEALTQGRDASIAARATMHLMHIHCNRYHLNAEHCAKHISSFKLTSTRLSSSCPSFQKTCEESEIKSKYRSIDGSCNDVNDASRGKSFTSYKRLLFPHYLDGIREVRRSVNRKFPLPSPRVISTTLCKNRDNIDSEITLAVMQWSQFVEHDLAHTATNKMVFSQKTIECCDPDGYNLSPRYVHPYCLSISVPEDDVFYSQFYVQCMPYVRSVVAMRQDCSFGPIEQMNQATHFLDGSQIYGTSPQKAAFLRTMNSGLLKISRKQNRVYLPISKLPTEDCQYNVGGSTCFISGDSRVNTHPHLTAMYTLWHKEHNRIATKLADINPHWDDEILYQEARRIVIAEIQHVTYNEWMPLILGGKYAQKILHTNKYSKDIDSSVSNSFATAALRFINSLMQGKLRLYLENRNINMSLNLYDHFNKPTTIEKPGHFDALIRGLATQHSQKLDMDYVQDITSQLFRSGDYGLDVLSLDIQRGRDHGLPSYVAYRNLCGLPAVQTFEDLLDVMPQQVVNSLMKVYQNPADIDLLVGGMSERPYKGSLMGPTFSCIISDQLLRTRRGDRYFYSNKDHPTPFTELQLQEIKKITLARIFCNNGDEIRMMQPNVFKKISESNNLVDCHSHVIPNVSLLPWSEAQFRR